MLTDQKASVCIYIMWQRLIKAIICALKTETPGNSQFAALYRAKEKENICCNHVSQNIKKIVM